MSGLSGWSKAMVKSGLTLRPIQALLADGCARADARYSAPVRTGTLGLRGSARSPAGRPSTPCSVKRLAMTAPTQANPRLNAIRLTNTQTRMRRSAALCCPLPWGQGDRFGDPRSEAIQPPNLTGVLLPPSRP